MNKIFLVILICSNFAFGNYLGKKRIAIIGGGMAGVSAAAFLSKSGSIVHLLEKENRVGGHAKTVLITQPSGKKVHVDLGPQYFAQGGWDLYIQFLKYFREFNERDLYKFTSSTTIFKANQKYPDIIDLHLNDEGIEWLVEKEESLGRFLSLLTFMDEAHKFYKKRRNISVGEFLRSLEVSSNLQQEIIKPLISTSLNSPLQDVEDGAMITTAGLLAFRNPLETPEFFVSKVGLQYFVEKILNKTSSNWKNFHLHLSTEVESVFRNRDGSFQITYPGGTLEVDQIIFAVHPFVLENILQEWDEFQGLWEKFTYGDTHVVIHNNRGFLHPKYQGFYNIKVREDGEYYLAMNLEKISPDFGDLIKSWNLTTNEYSYLKKRGNVLAEAYFKHPITTPAFIDGINELKQRSLAVGNLFFAGGWSLNWENQNTAVLSGFLAAVSCDPSIKSYWLRNLPILRDYIQH